MPASSPATIFVRLFLLVGGLAARLLAAFLLSG
jgi:hypothetical protein